MAKIGLSKPRAAVYNADGTTVTYSNPTVIGKYTAFGLTVESSDDNNLYADNAIAETDPNFAGGTATLTTDDLSPTVMATILGLAYESISTTTSDSLWYLWNDSQVIPYLGIGGIITGSELLSPQFLTAQFLRIAMLCAVNCYALISGFVGWNRTPKLSSLLRLWVKVMAFCVLITVMTQLRAPETVGLQDLWKAFTPVKEAKYWYFNAYVGLFFFIPLLNHAIRSITGREAVFAMVGIFLLVLWLPHTRLSEVFLLANGYSALWLVILYAMGGLMARFELPGKLPAKFWALPVLPAAVSVSCLNQSQVSRNSTRVTFFITTPKQARKKIFAIRLPCR